MQKTKKALASLVIVGMVATLVPFNVFASTGVTTDRLQGSDRFGTAIAVAEKFGTATTAILAPAEDAHLVDALAAAPLAGTNSPILLTEGSVLTATTKAELTKLGVKNVYVVGAIDQTVADQVTAMGITVTVIKGANRIETAAMISARLTNPAGTFVVGFNGLADALSVASYAAAHNFKVLVTNPDGNLPSTSSIVGKGYTVGGVQRVKRIAGVDSLAGSDRYATNKAVLDTLAYTYNNAYVATGKDGHLVDSLVGSSLAAKTLAPIVLSDEIGGDATAADVNAKLADNAVVTALGGTDVVTDATLNMVAYGSTVDPQVAIVVAAGNAVKAYEDAPLVTAADIIAAEALEIAANANVALVTDAYVDRIADKKVAVDAAKAEFSDVELATVAVTALETAAGADLAVEANLITAEAAVTAANTALANVDAGTVKDTLQVKVTADTTTVTDARTAFDAVMKVQSVSACLLYTSPSPRDS